MTQRVTFGDASSSGSGVLVLPEVTTRAPSIVVIQEYWGVNDHITAITARWAAAGFVALAPDLYGGKIAKTADEARAMMAGLDRSKALADIAAAVDFLRTHPRSTGRVAVTGYCLGGALCFALACEVKGLAAVVPFYGLPPSADWTQVDAPIQAHFAMHDDWATVDGAKKIQSVLGSRMELHVYDAKHAFCNDSRPEVYDRAAAELAWSRAVEFVRAHV